MSRSKFVLALVSACLFSSGCVPAGGDGDGGGDDCPAGESLNPVSGDCEAVGGNNTTSNNTSNNTTGANNTTSTNNASNNTTGGANNTTGTNNATNNVTVNNTAGVNNTTGTNNTSNNTGGDTATLFGVVTRSAAPAAGGVGGLYLAVFDGDPLGGGQLVANSRIVGADMTSPDAAIAYQIEGIPARADEYFIIGFLDDNETVDPNDEDSQRPDRGDLVSLQGFGAPKVTIDVAGEKEFDIDLNVNMPF